MKYPRGLLEIAHGKKFFFFIFPPNTPAWAFSGKGVKKIGKILKKLYWIIINYLKIFKNFFRIFPIF
jgi:hypothetical protein